MPMSQDARQCIKDYINYHAYSIGSEPNMSALKAHDTQSYNDNINILNLEIKALKQFRIERGLHETGLELLVSASQPVGEQVSRTDLLQVTRDKGGTFTLKYLKENEGETFVCRLSEGGHGYAPGTREILNSMLPKEGTVDVSVPPELMACKDAGCQPPSLMFAILKHDIVYKCIFDFKQGLENFDTYELALDAVKAYNLQRREAWMSAPQPEVPMSPRMHGVLNSALDAMDNASDRGFTLFQPKKSDQDGPKP